MTQKTETRFGTGKILAQTSGTTDNTPRSLTPPANAGYARLVLSGADMSARYDAQPATGGPAEEKYQAGGVLELTSVQEINGFRYISTGGSGTFSVIYREF